MPSWPCLSARPNFSRPARAGDLPPQTHRRTVQRERSHVMSFLVFKLFFHQNSIFDRETNTFGRVRRLYLVFSHSDRPN